MTYDDYEEEKKGFENRVFEIRAVVKNPPFRKPVLLGCVLEIKILGNVTE